MSHQACFCLACLSLGVPSLTICAHTHSEILDGGSIPRPQKVAVKTRGVDRGALQSEVAVVVHQFDVHSFYKYSSTT